jgi:hypothetical protein
VAVSVLTGDGHEGQSYVLTGPVAISFNEVAATFSKVLGRAGVVPAHMTEEASAVSHDLAAGTRAAVRDRPGTALSGSGHVLENLAAFQADPCASTWYGFVVRLGLLIDASEVRELLGACDPFPVVTTQALDDARLARGVIADQGAG